MAFDLNDPDLVAYWPFDEGGGTVVNDLSQNNYDGTFVGGTSWTGGIYGSALQFNGNDAYVETDQSILDNLDGFTLAGWVSANNVDVYSSLFGQNDLAEFGFIGGYQVGTWLLGNNWQLIAADYTFDYPSWHHLALAGDATRIVIYIDGEEAASDEGGLVSGISGYTFKVGAGVFNSSGDPFLGEIDDVKVFSRRLNQDEIQSLMPGSKGYPYALRPLPEDGDLHNDTWINLNWRAGDFAVSHDVYLGDSFEDVNNDTGNTFIANQAETFYVAGFPGFAYPDGLIPGTTYYWRVDEVNDAEPNSPWKGDIWSFTIPPREAYNPIPADDTAFIDMQTDLNWSGGLGAKLHTIYFGYNFDDVNNATAGEPHGTTTYDPGTLESNKTYYWRVDETDPPTIHKGDVWSFTTTIDGLGTLVVERWDNIEGDNLAVLKSHSKYPNNPDVIDVLTEFSSDLDLDSYGGRIYGWLYAPATGEYTFWLSADNQGELWLSTDDDPGNAVLIANESSWAGPNTWGTGEEQSNPIQLLSGNKYYIEAIWKEGTGGDQCQVAWKGPSIPAITIIPGSNLSPYEPVQASGPNPGNGSSDINQTSILNWKAGIQAASHEIYFGTNADAVKNANMASPEYKGSRKLGAESYDPGQLLWDTTYYWRIDEVNDANPDSPWAGNLWSFTTANFLIVDDMELYNDINEGEPGSNRIYLAWVDGFDNPAINGSVVGYATVPFTEQTIVHSGSQSMPFSYDNSVGKSEATLTLTYPRDWTENGVNTLEIWYIGDAANAAEPMYVVLNGTATVTNENPNAAQVTTWTEWTIDLQSFGVNLTNVNTITLGFGNRNNPVAGGAGMVFFDDIKVTSTSSLVSHWKFDEKTGSTAYDSWGSNDGIITDATWVNGLLGGALDFDGSRDYVNVGNDDSLEIDLTNTNVTISAWLYPKVLDNYEPVFVVDDYDGAYYGYMLMITPDGNVWLTYGDGTGTDSNNRRTKTGTTSLQTNIWYHVVGIIRGATDMSIFINGLNDGGRYSGNGGEVLYSSASASIGRVRFGTLDNEFNGSLDDVMVFNRALTEGEVRLLPVLLKRGIPLP
ncbi:MAG: hypothetical protein GY845_35660 [Planctomycetes bacterium]|nr:hypothetical protein [Planctomycetota bacterium]